MRVLEIVADGNPGGGTTHVLQILRGLKDSISFELVTQINSYLLREAQTYGIPCYGVDFFHGPAMALIPFQLRRICAKFQPQVVHVHGGRAAFFHSLAFSYQPVVYTIHGLHFPHKSRILRFLALQAERFVFQRTTRVVFVSQYDGQLANAFRLLGKNASCKLIYHGIVEKNIPHAQSFSPRHIGFIGRLEHQKDPLLFLDALEHLPNFTATIVGSGKLRNLINREVRRRGLADRVQMLGELSHSETLKVLSTFSAIVLTSRWEGLPLVVLEAMWAGVPVVSVNVSGIGELIENEVNGVLAMDRSGKNLASGVKRVTEDFPFKEFVIRNARSKVKERFSEQQMLISINQVYQEVG